MYLFSFLFQIVMEVLLLKCWLSLLIHGMWIAFNLLYLAVWSFEEYLLTWKMLVNFSREGMMSYKQFIQELEDDVLPAEAERR